MTLSLQCVGQRSICIEMYFIIYILLDQPGCFQGRGEGSPRWLHGLLPGCWLILYRNIRGAFTFEGWEGRSWYIKRCGVTILREDTKWEVWQETWLSQGKWKMRNFIFEKTWKQVVFSSCFYVSTADVEDNSVLGGGTGSAGGRVLCQMSRWKTVHRLGDLLSE